ncbi:MAG: hypothetical protein J5662_02575 [Clostridia bacterium]|nr:hypothetical protein [Clostridia bacterium]
MKVKLPFRLKFSRFFANKKIAIAFSLLLSFAIWLSVMLNQNPVREQTFTDISANITLENTAASDLGLGIVSDISSQRFTVTVSGPNYIVSSLTSDDFLLSADVSDINTAGTHTLSIFGNRNSNKSGYTFKSITPATIDVIFDYIDSKEFTVIPKLAGVSAEEGLVAETPVVANSEQSTITVKGPRATVEKIDAVVSYAAVNETLSETKTFDSYIVLCEKGGKILYEFRTDGSVVDGEGNTVTNSYLSLSFTTLKVTQPISKKATLPVKATFTNLPSGIKEDEISYTLDHKSATVIGTPDVVAKMDAVTLVPIDFTTVSTASNKFEVAATLKDGVKLFDTIEFFTVTVDTSDYSEKTFTVNNIKCTNLGSSLTVTSDKSIKNVKICGPKAIIADLKAGDVYAVADLSGKSAGSYTADVVIKSDKSNAIWQVGNYSIAVNIK